MRAAEEGNVQNQKHIQIYPDLIPMDEEHPTTGKFEVVNTTDERGNGLRAKAPFQAGQPVTQLSGVVVRRATLDTIQISPELHMSDPWFARFLLHCCEPNLAIDTNTMMVRAVKPILPGDYLTIDYAATEDKLGNQFACHCGAPTCRGWMMGRREQPNEEGRAFLAARQR